MTLLYSSPKFLEHKTGRHPEKPERVSSITQRLEKSGLAAQCKLPAWQPVSMERLTRIHEAEYIGEVRRMAEAGGGQIEGDTIVSRESYAVALLACGAACDAVERVVRGEDTQALAVIRPPGHHALAKSAMGFCLFNNAAAAARTAIKELDLSRVLIVDWDVHHGNATQDAFWRDPQVGFLSIHRHPFYPGTGLADETGAGDAVGTKLNLPIAFGTSRDRYLSLFTRELEQFADKFKPELVIVSAGFDAHREDPVGSLGLEVEDFENLTEAVLNVAAAHAGGKVVSLLEGGYHLERLGESVELHLRTLRERQADEQKEKRPPKP